MQNSLFSIDLPLVNTNEELEKIKSMYSDCDTYFIASSCIKERREKFNNLWSQFKPLLAEHKSKTFLSKIKQKGQFHENTWEMYVGCVLKKYFSDVSTKRIGRFFYFDGFLKCGSNKKIECNIIC